MWLHLTKLNLIVSYVVEKSLAISLYSPSKTCQFLFLSKFLFYNLKMDYTHTQAEEFVAVSIIIHKHGLQPWGLQRHIWGRLNISLSECTILFCLLLSLSEVHAKIRSPVVVISSVPKRASDIFLHPPSHSADRPFGVKNTQSLCVIFLNFFASLSCAFPGLMTMLSKLGT